MGGGRLHIRVDQVQLQFGPMDKGFEVGGELLEFAFRLDGRRHGVFLVEEDCDFSMICLPMVAVTMTGHANTAIKNW